MQHRPRGACRGGVGRRLERHTPERGLGAADPLGHRGLRNEEPTGDLCGSEATDRAQGERDLDGAVSAWWQHRNSSVSVSSCALVPATSAVLASDSGSVVSSSRRRRARSLRSSSISRREATVNSHARGFSGTPSAGHCVAAASSASWAASSHASKCACRRTRMPSTSGASGRRRCSTPRPKGDTDVFPLTSPPRRCP